MVCEGESGQNFPSETTLWVVCGKDRGEGVGQSLKGPSPTTRIDHFPGSYLWVRPRPETQRRFRVNIRRTFLRRCGIRRPTVQNWRSVVVSRLWCGGGVGKTLSSGAHPQSRVSGYRSPLPSTTQSGYYFSVCFSEKNRGSSKVKSVSLCKQQSNSFTNTSWMIQGL